MVEAAEHIPQSYDVSFDIKKHFTPQEITGNPQQQLIGIELQDVFKHYDVNKDGNMDAKEFKKVC